MESRPPPQKKRFKLLSKNNILHFNGGFHVWTPSQKKKKKKSYLAILIKYCTICCRKQKRNSDIVAGARAPQRNDARDDQKPIGGVGELAAGHRSVESRLLPVEGLDGRLGDVRQRENSFGRTSSCRRK